MQIYKNMPSLISKKINNPSCRLITSNKSNQLIQTNRPYHFSQKSRSSSRVSSGIKETNHIKNTDDDIYHTQNLYTSPSHPPSRHKNMAFYFDEQMNHLYNTIKETIHCLRIIFAIVTYIIFNILSDVFESMVRSKISRNFMLWTPFVITIFIVCLFIAYINLFHFMSMYFPNSSLLNVLIGFTF